ncbi:MAG: EVE domain-containing protein [Bacteroidia bacterium]|nr:EVE domain-containing protein [Bacteroidia bacterium]MDW8133733.1 EVE domain-containing protein [Bacteroidia bacterium]
MAYWLVKSEPEEYNFTDLERDKRVVWDGVRNPQAQKYLKAMVIGDKVLYYHTGKEKAIVGVARVIQSAYPDPTDPKYVVIDLEPDYRLSHPIYLQEIKVAFPPESFALLRQPRLSVMPVPPEVWAWVLAKQAKP